MSDELPADLQSALTSASEGLIADLSAPEGSAPAPEPVEATPSVPVPPVETAPAAPTTIDTQTLSPEAKRFLEMHGGDPNKALAKALADNNRLAELHRSGQPTVPAATPVPPPPVATPQAPPVVAAPAPAQDLPPVVIDPAEVTKWTKQYMARDTDCRQFDQTFTNNLTRLQAIQADEAKYLTDNQQKTWELGLAEVAADPMRQADIRTAMRDNRAELLALKQERLVLEAENAQTFTKWENARLDYESRVRAALTGQAEETRQKEYHAAQEAQAQQALESAWPPAITAAMETHKIPADERAAFNTFCKNAAIAELDFGMIDRVEAQQFVSAKAVEFAAMFERAHRYQSAVYGQQAHTRAQINSTPGPVAVATEAPKATNMSLEQMLEAAASGFRADVASSF